jgi:predicted site-specific integrase-resolvase
MSCFTANIKHPITGKKVKANYIDDYFGKHKYGIVLVGSNDNDPVYREEDIVNDIIRIITNFKF